MNPPLCFRTALLRFGSRYITALVRDAGHLCDALGIAWMHENPTQQKSGVCHHTLNAAFQCLNVDFDSSWTFLSHLPARAVHMIHAQRAAKVRFVWAGLTCTRHHPTPPPVSNSIQLHEPTEAILERGLKGLIAHKIMPIDSESANGNKRLEPSDSGCCNLPFCSESITQSFTCLSSLIIHLSLLPSCISLFNPFLTFKMQSRIALAVMMVLARSVFAQNSTFQLSILAPAGNPLTGQMLSADPSRVSVGNDSPGLYTIQSFPRYQPEQAATPPAPALVLVVSRAGRRLM